MINANGPVGIWEEFLSHDRGILPRTDPSPPGPIGLRLGPAIAMQVKATAANTAHTGIVVHSKSQISAEQWVAKIKASQSVPDHYQSQLNWNKDTIYVTNPKKFRIPDNVIRKDWVNDWLSAFMNPEWEMTTGCLDFVVEKRASARPTITITHNPDLSNGEAVDGYTKSTMTEKSGNGIGLKVERGNTLPTGISLKSGRKAIVVANRVDLKLGGQLKTFKFEDDELLEVWFHELAAHAGRHSQGLVDTHGNRTVDSYDSDIRDMFGKTTTVPKLMLELEKFLRA